MAILRLRVPNDQGVPAATNPPGRRVTPRFSSSRPYSCAELPVASSTAASQAASRDNAYSRAATWTSGWKKNRRSASAGTQPSQRSARLMCASSWQIAMRCCRSSSRANRCAGSSTTGRSRPATSGVSTSSDSRTSGTRRRRRRAPRSRVLSRVSASAGVEFAMTLRVCPYLPHGQDRRGKQADRPRRRQHARPGHRDPDPGRVHALRARHRDAVAGRRLVRCGRRRVLQAGSQSWNAGRRQDGQHDRRDPDKGDHELGAGRPPDEGARGGGQASDRAGDDPGERDEHSAFDGGAQQRGQHHRSFPWRGVQPRHDLLELAQLVVGDALGFREVGDERRDRPVEIALDEPLHRPLEEVRRGCPGAVAVDPFGRAARQMALAPEPLHHRQHRGAGEAARGAELLGRFADARAAAIRDVAEQRQFLLPDRAIRHGPPVTTRVVKKASTDDTCSQAAAARPL